MNGETKSYNLRVPMSWANFLDLPDDLKAMYISGIRDRFRRPPLSAFAEMFGASKTSVYRGFDTYKIPRGVANSDWDKDGFFSWVDSYRIKPPQVDEKEVQVAEQCMAEETPSSVPTAPQDVLSCLSGTLTFDGAADAALALVSSILGLADVHLKIEWEARPKTCDTAKEE